MKLVRGKYMAMMQTVQYKEHEGLGQLSSAVLPWCGSAFGSQLAYGESCKPFTLELPSSGNQVTTATKQRTTHQQGLDKGITNQFTLFSGNVDKSQPVISTPKYRDHFELWFSQPVGRIMLPLNLTTDEGAIYVNAKQYHGIIRRRQSRAKTVIKNIAAKLRRPYMHESRHLHAMRRPRGCGGRFLNTKTSNNEKSENGTKHIGDMQLFRYSGSQNSEVLQSETATLNSSKTNSSGSNISGSEVTSTYSRGDLDHFSMNHHLGHSVHSLSDVMDGTRGVVIPSKWIAAVDNCCNLSF